MLKSAITTTFEGFKVATMEESLEIDPRAVSDVGGGSADQTPSVSIPAASSTDGAGDGDAPPDIEQGGGRGTQSPRSAARSNRPSVAECLSAVPDTEMADLSLDVYNMFFLSDFRSQAFVYSLAVLITKAALYVLLAIDLVYNKKFPYMQGVEARGVVRLAQLFLIPVAIVNQEELITSFFIFSHLKYNPEIRPRHPEAYKWKYVVAHTTRFLDGLMFLVLNTAVMLLEIQDVLQLFLNFAALQFLQSIDNIALQICLDGYWTKALQESAQDVVDMKFAYRHHYVHQFMQMSFVICAWGLIFAIWLNVHYIRDPEAEA